MNKNRQSKESKPKKNQKGLERNARQEQKG